MSPSFAQYRTSYIFLFIGLLGATLWTAYYLFGVHYKVLPVGGIGYYRPRPAEEPKQQPWVGFHYSHTAIDIVIPSQVKIIGLVFFGRRDFVTILDCYLKVATFLPCATFVTLTTHTEKPPGQRGLTGRGYLRG
jgi:hypothetical protein